MAADEMELADLLRRAGELDASGRHEEELGIYDEVIDRFAGLEDPAVVAQVLRARLDKAITLYDLERELEALAVLDDLRARCAPGGEGDHEQLNWLVARTIKYQGFALEVLDRSDEALARYEEVAARFEGQEDPEVLADVARSLRQKASLLWQLDRREEAIRTGARVSALSGRVEDEELALAVAQASVEHAARLTTVGATAEALEAYNIACQGDLAPYALSKAQYGRGHALRLLGRVDEAMAQFAEASQAFADDDDPYVRWVAAAASTWHGTLLWRGGRREEAVAAYRRAADVAASSDLVDLRKEHARALLKAAAGLAALGRAEQAIASLDGVLVAHLDDDDLSADVNRALREKLVLLSEAGRASESAVVAEALVDRLATEPGDLAGLEVALSATGAALAVQGRMDDAISAFDDAVSMVADSDDPLLRAAAGLALSRKAATLGQLGRIDEAMAVQQEMVERFGADMLEAFDERSSDDLGAETPVRRAQEAPARAAPRLVRSSGRRSGRPRRAAERRRRCVRSHARPDPGCGRRPSRSAHRGRLSV